MNASFLPIMIGVILILIYFLIRLYHHRRLRILIAKQQQKKEVGGIEIPPIIESPRTYDESLDEIYDDFNESSITNLSNLDTAMAGDKLGILCHMVTFWNNSSSSNICQEYIHAIFFSSFFIAGNLMLVQLVFPFLTHAKQITLHMIDQVLLLAGELSQVCAPVIESYSNVLVTGNEQCFNKPLQDYVNIFSSDSIINDFLDSFEEKVNILYHNADRFFQSIWSLTFFTSLLGVSICLAVVIIVCNSWSNMIPAAPIPKVCLTFFAYNAGNINMILLFLFVIVGVITASLMCCVYLLLSIIQSDFCIDPSKELQEIVVDNIDSAHGEIVSVAIAFIIEGCDSSVSSNRALLEKENTFMQAIVSNADQPLNNHSISCSSQIGVEELEENMI